MKNWKFFTLLSIILCMAGVMTSCKDDDEKTLESISVYNMSVGSVEIANVSKPTDAEKKMVTDITKDINESIKNLAKFDTTTVQKAMVGFEERMNQLLDKYKNGSALVTNNRTLEIIINLVGGPYDITGESKLILTNNSCEYGFTPSVRLCKVYYNMIIPYTYGYGVEEWDTADIKDGLDAALAEAGWPKYNIERPEAEAAYDKELQAQVEKAKSYCETLNDTATVSLDYVLNYGGSIILKRNTIVITHNDVTLK